MVLKSQDGEFMFEKSSRMNFRERLFVSGLSRLDFFVNLDTDKMFSITSSKDVTFFREIRPDSVKVLIRGQKKVCKILVVSNLKGG